MKHRIMMISTHGYVAAQPELGKPDTGGQVVYVLELSKSLARLGYEVDILTRQFEDQPDYDPVAPGVNVLRFPCGGSEFIPKETLIKHIPEWVEQVFIFMRREARSYSLINSHYWDAGVAGELLADQMRVPHWHTPHSLGIWKRENMNGRTAELEHQYNFRQRIALEKRVYRTAQRVVATTAEQKQLLLSDYDVPEERIALIPPGYDDSRFFPLSSDARATCKETLNLKGPIVFAVGRIARNKGYDLLIRSMPTVLRRVPRARLLLAVGAAKPNEEERSILLELKETAREVGVQRNILFHDYIPDDLLPNYYHAADAFALSSRYEPFGMTAIEAMACGTPTVLTTHGGLWKEVEWGHDALFSDPQDPEAFGHALCYVLMQPTVAASLSRRGAVTARDNYTWSHIAGRFLEDVWPINPPSDEHGSIAHDVDKAMYYGDTSWLIRNCW